MTAQVLASVGAAPVEPLSRNRDFRRLWIGETVSMVGTATGSVLIPLVAVFACQAGPGWMGALTAATWLPWLVLGLPAGAWVDQLPLRRVMIAADLLAAGALVSVPIALVADVLTLPHLLVTALLTGTATVFFRTAYAGMLPSIVADEHLEPANARMFGTESAAQVAGPGLAGVIAQWLSAAVGVLLDAVSFLVSALFLWRIRPPVRQATTSPTASLRSRIADGVRWLRRDRYLRWLVVIGGLSNFGLTGLNTLMVLFLVDDLGLAESGVGVVLAAGSVGGLLGAFVAPRISARWGSGRASTVMLLLSGPPALVVALGGAGWRTLWVVAGLATLGLCVVAGNVVRGAWRQRYVPVDMLGRVTSCSQLVNFGTMPLAALCAGALAGSIGIRTTLLVMAAIHLLATCAILISPLARLRTLPLPTR